MPRKATSKSRVYGSMFQAGRDCRRDLRPCLSCNVYIGVLGRHVGAQQKRIQGRVADILNTTCPLTLEMIRRLVAQLDFPADVLVKPYRLREELLAA